MHPFLLHWPVAVAYTGRMADRQVDVVTDVARWEANHAGQVAPTGQVTEADYRPTSSGFTGSLWHTCVRCGHVDRSAAMALISGKWYCTFSNCSEEVTR